MRRHVAEQREGFEATGRIVVRGDDLRAVEYHRVRNGAGEPLRAQWVASWRPTPGHFSVLTHSHPDRNPQPSDADLTWAADRTYRGREHRAVFWAADFLHVYRLLDVGTRAYEQVRVFFEIEA